MSIILESPWVLESPSSLWSAPPSVYSSPSPISYSYEGRYYMELHVQIYILSIIEFPSNKKYIKKLNVLVVVDVIKLFSNNLFQTRPLV